jgi:anthranilate phosphoribosyltransferase
VEREPRAGATRDSLIYGGALCLWHVGCHESLAGAAQAVRTVLDRGKALAHLRRMG